MKQIYRGDLFYADLGHGIGSEQRGYRPVLIIQNNTGNKYSPTTIIAALTCKTASKVPLPTHYLLGNEAGLKKPSIVLLEQVRTIDKARLGRYIGHLTPIKMEDVEKAIRISLEI